MSDRVGVIDCNGSGMLGILHLPRGGVSRVGVVVVVGGPQYRVGSHRQFILMARMLADAGQAVLRFDYRGMGDSEGDYRGFQHTDDDIEAAIKWFMTQVPSLEGVVLWGLCDAASACLFYGLRRDPRVRGMILVNPECRTEAAAASTYLRHYYWNRLLQRSFWNKAIKFEFKFGRSVADFMRTLLQARKLKAENSTAAEDSQGNAAPAGFVQRMLSGMQRFRGSVLVLLSGKDLTARAFEDLCSANADWKTAIGAGHVTTARVETADHTFSRRDDLVASVGECTAWLKKLVSEKIP